MTTIQLELDEVLDYYFAHKFGKKVTWNCVEFLDEGGPFGKDVLLVDFDKGDVSHTWTKDEFMQYLMETV